PLIAAPKAVTEAEDGKGYRVYRTEEEVFRYHPTATHFRYPQIYGAYQITPREWPIVRRILDKRPFIILPDDGLTLNHSGAAANMAHALLLEVDQPRVASGQVYNCGDEQSSVPCRRLLNSQGGLHRYRSGAGLPWERIIAASTYSWHYPIILRTCGGEYFKSNERIRRSEIRARPPHPVRVHGRAGTVPRGDSAIFAGEIAPDRSPAPHGHRRGVRSRDLAPAQRTTRAARDSHTGAIRRRGLRHGRALHCHGGDGSCLAVRALLLHDGARDERDIERWYRSAEIELATRSCKRRATRRAGRHRA